MARYLSVEWIQAFDAALGALDLSEAVAAAASGSLAAADGAFSIAQLVSGVPADVTEGSPAGEVRVVLSVADGHAHLALDTEGIGAPVAAEATATIALGYADALALALGRLDPADALAAGRVRVRGDLAALVAGQQVLAAAAGLLGSALDDLTDPIDSSAPSASEA
ncbi:MAG TPA: SCP2 sterol-binding domain-containing protein [Acidimicrobiales bacterium]|nr:SCP2 sterol-binding domain-containing protein [Acidimicrobiales bacterium]